MIVLRASQFIVDYDDDEYKYHVYVRDYKGGETSIVEITDELTNESKDELIEDLIYALKRLLEQDADKRE